PNAPWSFVKDGDKVVSLREEGRVTDEQWLTFLANAVDLQMNVRPQVVAGRPFPLSIGSSYRSTRGPSWMARHGRFESPQGIVGIVEVVDATFGGQPISPQDVNGYFYFETPSLMRSALMPLREVDGQVTRNVEKGDQELQVTIKLTAVLADPPDDESRHGEPGNQPDFAEPPNLMTAGRGRRYALEQGNSPPAVTRTFELSAGTEVIAAADAPSLVVDDPELIPLMQRGVRATAIGWTNVTSHDGETERRRAIRFTGQPDIVRIKGLVSIRYGDESASISRGDNYVIPLFLSTEGHDFRFGTAMWFSPKAEALANLAAEAGETVEIWIHPDTSRLAMDFDPTPVWGFPLLLDDIPVVDEDVSELDVEHHADGDVKANPMRQPASNWRP
ncbi:MAG: hypothetical protein AAF561_08115, partial [Planctomycetota bacterium]